LTKGLGFAEIFGSLLLLLIMIGANYYQQVQITNLNPMVRQNQQMNSQMQFMRFFPIVFGLICIRLPSGLVLYYAVSALFRVGQQWMMYHYDPKVIALVAKDDRDIEVMEARLEETERRKGKPQQGKPQPAKPQQAKPQPAKPLPAGSEQAGLDQAGGQPGTPGPPQPSPASGQAKTSQARLPQAKQPRPLPPAQDGAPADGKATDGKPADGKATDGKANGQVPSRNPNTQATSQRNRNRRRKGR
jgi:hypothetical protein